MCPTAHSVEQRTGYFTCTARNDISWTLVRYARRIANDATLSGYIWGRCAISL
ncbi:hypothetical protein WH47_12493 [Habropoda laboriosa]|uniref:Uncharacterized protein n=1 Tax=Habropoda laboriosa TaxID=597456 RepID=A0A0L7R061_9HYME|nr:hypothetical protein WH47_12493 [Habropoda laboriosa]